MPRIASLALALAIASSACTADGRDDVCTDARKAGLVIFVRDTDTRAPLLADVVVSEGAYVEAYGPEDAAGGDNPRYFAAEERPGDYAITASSPGYLPAMAAAVVDLTADGCNVETVTVYVDLPRTRDTE
jgi:hypothetical protein